MEFTTTTNGASAADATVSGEVTGVVNNYSLINVDVDLDDELLFHNILYKVVVPVMFGLIIGVGLVGNALVMYVTLMYRTMRTTVNLLLLNLAVSDLIFLVVAVPFIAYHFAADNWLIGDVVCKLSHFVLYVTVYVTVYTLVAISVVRFVSIVRSSPRPAPAPGRVAAVVAAVWTTMLVVNLPLLALYRVKSFLMSPDSAPYHYCGLVNHHRHGPPLFITFFTFTYVIPLFVIITMYLLIVRYLVARRRGLSLQTTVNGDRSGRLQRVQNRRTSYAWRVFLAVVVVFGVCWLPMHAHLLVAYFGLQPNTRAYAVFRVFCHCLAYTNSCVNPFVYHYVSADFRRCLADVAATLSGTCGGRQQRDRQRQRRFTLDRCTASQHDGITTFDQRRF